MGQNGMDAEKLQVGVKTLVSQMDAAAGGSKSATEAFKKLGVSWDDGNGKLKSQEVIMSEAINALAGMEDGSERAKLATELFGKAGAEMAPMLNTGAQGIEDLKNRAHELGLVMSDESVNMGVVLGDTIDDVKATFGAIITKIGVEVMPVIQNLLDIVLQNMPQIQATVAPVFEFLSSFFTIAVEKIGNLASSLSDILAPAFETMSTWFSGSGAESAEIFNIAFDAIGIVIKAVAEIVAWFITVLDQYVFKNQETMTFIKEIWDGIKETFSLVLEAITLIVQNWIQEFEEFWNKYGETITTYASAVWDNIKIIIDTVLNVINSLLKIFISAFQGDWNSVWEECKNLLSIIWDGIKALVQNSLEGIINIFGSIAWQMQQAGADMFNSVLDGIKGVWDNISDFVSDKIDWISDKLSFWRKSENEMSSSNSSNSSIRINGSHANGLDYVPYDGYIAELHQGEEVVTAEAKKNGSGSKIVYFNPTFVISASDGKAVSREIQKDLTNYNRALGVT